MRLQFELKVAIAVLVGVACVPIPSWAQLAITTPAITCSHNIDQTKCPFCDPSRIERLGLCREHHVAEALCVQCKPYLKVAFETIGDWCVEHNTPESQCALCNPARNDDSTARAIAAGVELRWQRDPAPTCSTSSNPITLTSAAAAQAAGLEFVALQNAPLTHVVERNVEVAYNANRFARLSTRAGGIVTQVLKDLGESVRKGDALAIVDSSDLGTAKAEFLQAIEMVNLWTTTAQRKREMLQLGVGTEREAIEAEATLAEARITLSKATQHLRTLGLSNDQIELVRKDNDTSSLLTIAAPFDGLIVDRSAVIGEVVEPGVPLLAVADVSVMWGMADLSESDLAVVKTGQLATITVDGLPGKTFAGRLTWISTQVDPKSRTLKARIELDNGDGMLRANMFGRARINAGESREALTVPKSAVQWEGCCNVAFVRTSADGSKFQPARLVLGFDAGDRYEVITGLSPGDVVVTAGSFILKNEILKNSVGAGCCEVEHLKK